MKKSIEIAKSISAVIGVLTTIGGVLWLCFQVYTRTFTSVENRMKTENVIKDLDPVKMYGEYIMDSIEEVETQKYRFQQSIKDSIYMGRLESLDSLVRLNVYLTNKIEDGH